LINPAGGGICQVDPSGLVSESNEGNNTCSDTVTVTAPDLSANKSNNAPAGIQVGQTFQWSIAVSNSVSATAAASFSTGQMILTDNLPANATYGAPSVVTSGTSGSGSISCSINSNTLTCTASGGTVTIPAGASFTVTFDVTPTAAGNLANPASGGICQVDPNTLVSETDENNNTCGDTVTVDPLGTIVIIKDTVPDDPQDFAYTTTGTGLSNFSLDDDADGTLSNTKTFSNLLKGAYTVTETLGVAGFDLTNLVCVDPDNQSSVTLGTGLATIDLDAGETVTCTYTNTKRGMIVVQKIAIGGNGTFNYTTTGGNGLPANFSITTVGGAGSQTYTNILTGNYSVSETVPSDWLLTGAVCDTGTPAGFTLQPGATVTCTFTNEKAADLEIEKSHSGKFFVGQQGTYTLKVTNHGPSSADGPITVTDTLPTGMSFVSGTGVDWTCSAIAQVVTCVNPNSLANGAMTTITLIVTILPDIALSVKNTVCVSSPTPDPNLSNNCDDDDTEICLAEIHGVKYSDYDGDGNKDGNDQYLPGITVTVTGTDIFSNPISQTTVTNQNGEFVFKLPPGTYLVCEVIPPGTTQTYPTSGPTCPDGSYGHLVTLDCGEIATLNDGGTRIKFANMPVIEFGQEKFSVNGIHALATKGNVRFTVTGEGIKDMDVQIYDLKGRSLYSSGWQKNGWTWALQSDAGNRVAHGVYLYTIRVRGTKGETAKLQIKKLITLPLVAKSATASKSEKLAITDVHALNGKNAVFFLVGSRQAYKEMKIEVFNLRGERVYASGWQATSLLTWNLSSEKARLVSGVYLYVASVRDARGESVTRLQKLVLK
jgi:uncharacterized repeat protein (TIGR01451 family)/fimbrial isopeptide formation D2 family protein